MEANLFQTNKSVKILVLGEEKSLFTLETNVFGKLLKNDIEHVGTISDSSEKDMLSAIKPDIIIDLVKKEGQTVTLDVSAGLVIPRIQNIDVNQLKQYYEIFLLIDQIKQIKGQLKID